ncbi:MAG: glucokinase [Desulfobacterota bacterium]|jgi:glucokinase|nr:glucokinase [Thermodesulfobacteriota bacterium]
MKVMVAGDVGGTKTILALYSPGKGPREPLVRSSFPSSSHAGLEDLLVDFLADVQEKVDGAVFGVAGPVVGGSARITNLTWTIDASSLGSVLGTGRIHLLNDLEAVALGIPLLSGDDFHTIHRGEPVPHGPIAVIAPGTGLGEAYLTWDGKGYRAHASEGGHSDFAPRDTREADLLAFLLRRFDHVSYELVCSGSGIRNIYAFLRESGRYEEPAWLAQRLRNEPDPTIVIREAAQDIARPSEICRETMRMFVSILGAETGNLALKFLPTGGIYIGGGLPPRILSMIDDVTFIEAYLAKGRLSPVVSRIPVHVILNTDVGLIGAAGYGMGIMQNP